MRKGKEIDLLLAIRAKARAAVLASYPTDTVSGSPANFPDGADGVPVVDLSVAINPVQEGTGDPSPENIRPISGWTGLTLYQSGADTSDPEELAVSWASEAGTVYGGTLDVTTGVLTVTRGIVDFGDLNWNKGQSTSISWAPIVSGPLAAMKRPASNSVPVDAICSEYKTTPASGGHSNYQIYCNVSGSTYFGLYNANFAELTTSEIKAALTGVKMVFALNTPVTYQLTPTEVRTLLGENNIWADTGDVTVEYRADLEKYIEKKIGDADAGTLSLGAAPSMIRPGPELEMQPLGMDDAGVDYIDELPDADESLGDPEDDEDSYSEDIEEEELTDEPEEVAEEEPEEEETGEPEDEDMAVPEEEGVFGEEDDGGAEKTEEADGEAPELFEP